MANRPERSEAFILDEDSGEKKVEYVADTRMINAGTFLINKVWMDENCQNCDASQTYLLI
jgi:hypothetical protein